MSLDITKNTKKNNTFFKGLFRLEHIHIEFMGFVKIDFFTDPQPNPTSTQVNNQTLVDSIAPGTSLLKSNQPKVQGTDWFWLCTGCSVWKTSETNGS